MVFFVLIELIGLAKIEPIFGEELFEWLVGAGQLPWGYVAWLVFCYPSDQ